jgi:2-dehydro-3-deoxyphosphooctonate aldolase (KDO 8-P synthase)
MPDVIVGGNGVSQVVFGNAKPLSLIAGTCAIESRDITFRTAEHMVKLAEKLGFGLIYKGSFDKANRTSLEGQRGVGMEEGLRILADIRKEFAVPVLTDVHETIQVPAVAEAVDVLQIPAFLARQTDLLLACAKAVATQPGKAVNIKKGQFMAPKDMGPAAKKMETEGCKAVMLTERGTTFGYGDLVVDFRSFPTMAATGYPAIFDVTHSVMSPSGHGGSSGGKREFAAPLARGAVAVGVAGLFMETHPNPAEAISDKETQIPLAEMEAFLLPLLKLDAMVKAF